MARQITQASKQVAFSDMPGGKDRPRKAANRGASPWATQQHRDCGRDQRKVSDDCTPSVERRQVLRPVISCKLAVRRNHP
jgi:hypothetical protein